VVKELRNHFPYQDYRLIETFGVRAIQTGTAQVEGVMPGENVPAPTTYGFQAKIAKVTGEKGKELIDLSSVQANWRMPIVQPNGDFQFSEVHLDTTLTVPASKLVVVGKAGAATVSQGLFVVLRVDIVPNTAP